MPLIASSSEYKKLFSSEYRSDILPRTTAIDQVLSGQNSLYRLEKPISLPVNLPDSSEIYANEKSSNVDRIGIPKKIIIDGEEQIVFEPFYFKPYQSVLTLYDKMISSSLLGMHAVPHEPYGVIHGNRLGLATIDLTSLQNAETKQKVHSIRFDILLNRLGHNADTLTFLDLQNLFYDANISKIMDRRAFVQCALGNFFLANAFGETDPNSRNLILLENHNAEPMDEDMAKILFGSSYDPKNPPKKFGFAVRIDPDENTHDNSVNRERSGKKVVGRSILFSNESSELSLKLSKDDKHMLHEYSKNPHFILKGSFIPPDGMSEEEYVSQINEDDERLNSARRIFEDQILSSNPNLSTNAGELEALVEQKMRQHNCYARKKSFIQLIEEKNPNIDWGLFEELFTIANRSINETVIRFPADSMYYRQSRTFSSSHVSNRCNLSQEMYDEFALATNERVNNNFNKINRAISPIGKYTYKLNMLDTPSKAHYSLEPQPVDAKGVPKPINSNAKIL